MNPTGYLWFYGLIELLLLSTLSGALFAFGWWRLHRAHKRLTRICSHVESLCAAAIQDHGSENHAEIDPHDARIACLQAFATPFRRATLDNEALWRELLARIQRLADSHVVEDGRPGESEPWPQQPAPEATPLRPATDETDQTSAIELDAQFDTLLSKYEAGIEALTRTRKAKAGLEARYESLMQADQQLRERLETLMQNESCHHQLRQELDDYAQCNQEFMQAMKADKRAQHRLEAELEMLSQHSQNLQDSLKHQRKSSHKLLLDRDAIAEERTRLLEQLKMNEQLVTRLNRNYNALHREYTKLYESTQ